MKLVKLPIRIAIWPFKKGEYLQTSLQVAGITLPLWQYGPFVAVGGIVVVSLVLDHLQIPSCNWVLRDSFCSGVSAVVFGESKGTEDAFYTPLGLTIFLSLVVGSVKFIVGVAKLIYNEKRHLERLKAERVEAAQERKRERERERAAVAQERERERAAVAQERERERAAVLEWYEQHKELLSNAPPPPVIDQNGHSNGVG